MSVALRPCLHPGCPALTAKSRCAEHRDRARNVTRADSAWAWTADRIESLTRVTVSEMQFYSIAHWRRLSAAVVRVGRCHWCGVIGKRLVADHVRPVSRGGERQSRTRVKRKRDDVNVNFDCDRDRDDVTGRERGGVKTSELPSQYPVPPLRARLRPFPEAES